jgi:hypothetical protein
MNVYMHVRTYVCMHVSLYVCECKCIYRYPDNAISTLRPPNVYIHMHTLHKHMHLNAVIHTVMLLPLLDVSTHVKS